MKLMLFLIFTISLSAFAKDCTYSLESKYDSNIQFDKNNSNLFTKLEENLMWDIKRVIGSNVDCQYISNKKGLFHIRLKVFRYYNKVEYFGLIFKEEDQRTVGFDIDYDNKYMQTLTYTKNNREMVEKSLQFILSKL